MTQRLTLQVERERQGRSRADVARAAGINNTTYGWAERQRYRLLDSQLIKVARALGWPVEDREALLEAADHD